MNKCLILVAFISTSLLCSAQTFSVPENYKLETANDYYLYENDVLQAVEWLENTHISEQPAKWGKAQKFIFKWVEGVPYISVGISDLYKSIDSKKNPDLFMLYIGGYIKYAITTKDYDNRIEENMSGIQSVIYYYNKFKQKIGKQKGIEKYISMQEKGTLKEYVTNIVEKETKK